MEKIIVFLTLLSLSRAFSVSHLVKQPMYMGEPQGIMGPASIEEPGGIIGPASIEEPGGIVGPASIEEPGGIIGPSSIEKPGGIIDPASIEEPDGIVIWVEKVTITIHLMIMVSLFVESLGVFFQNIAYSLVSVCSFMVQIL